MGFPATGKRSPARKGVEARRQALNFRNAISKFDKPEQIEKLHKQRDTVNNQVEGLSEQAAKVCLESQLEEPQNRLNQVQSQLANKEREQIAARKGKIFVASAPDNATVKILNIDQPFQEGMELEPGEYRLQVSSVGYEPQERSTKLGPGEEKRINFELERMVFTNSIGMKFVLIPAGSFTMGSQLSPEEVAKRYGGKAESFEWEQPRHTVKITRPFYLQNTETTQAQWKKVMRYNLSNFKECGDDCPVEHVSGDDAQKFIENLNQKEGINKYRLPTEAEWEYACRAATETVYSFGDEVDKLGDYAWYKENSEERTHPVGQKKPNAWGLYDMYGNVLEWCQDGYVDYPSKSVVDPIGPDNGEMRIVRGGSRVNEEEFLRSASRHCISPNHAMNGIGFRFARDF